jgi:hypothetical protein
MNASAPSGVAGHGWWLIILCEDAAWVLWMRFGGGRIETERTLGEDAGDSGSRQG